MEDYAEMMSASFEDELKKIAHAKLKQAGEGTRVVPAMVAGAAGYEFLRRANQDRRAGRQMRLQSQYY